MYHTFIKEMTNTNANVLPLEEMKKVVGTQGRARYHVNEDEDFVVEAVRSNDELLVVDTHRSSNWMGESRLVH